MTVVTRLPIVGMIGSGSEAHEERAAALGSWLATQAVHLVTGAGQGVMATVSRAFAETLIRTGLVLGIVPSVAENRPEVPKPGYPHAWVEVPIFTHLHLSDRQGGQLPSRNHVVVFTAAVIVALPGSADTASEVRLALRYGRPLIAYLKYPDEIAELPDEVKWTPDLNEVKAFVRQGFLRSGPR